MMLLILLIIFNINNCLGQIPCQDINPPVSGKTSSTCVKAQINQVCRFECITGYVLNGPEILTCTTNGWSGTPCRNPSGLSCAPPTCDSPTCSSIDTLGTVSNGVYSGSCRPGISGRVCTISCAEGYRLVGNGIFTCQNGQWSSNRLPFCQQTPPPNCQDINSLGSVQNGIYSGQCNPGVSGQTCSISCVQGYRLVGNGVFICQSGQWSSNQLPFCQLIPPPNCPNIDSLGTVQNGIYSGQCSPGVSGQTCSITCAQGYRLVGNGVFMCQGEQWSSTQLPICQFVPTLPPTCPSIDTLGTVQNGIYNGQCRPGISGQSCTISCAQGYSLVGNGAFICQNGAWNLNQLPTCQLIQPQTCSNIDYLGTVENAVYTGQCRPGLNGQTCTIGCRQGYVLVGNGVFICQNGLWNSNQLPICRLDTPQVTLCLNIDTLGTVQNAIYTGQCRPGFSGQVCNITCADGYMLEGNSMFVCQNSQWFPSQLPRCTLNVPGTQTCPYIDVFGTVQNSVLVGQCRPGISGQVCSISCLEGYMVQGNSAFFCGNGVWNSSQLPTCSLIILSCPNLSPGPNVIMTGNCNPGAVGKTCQFSCSNGYALVGQGTWTCLSTGKWNYKINEIPSCAQVRCLSLRYTPNVARFAGASCSGSFPDGNCLILCNSGFRYNLTCKANGEWSENPECQFERCPILFAPSGASMTGVCQPGSLGQTCQFECGSAYYIDGSSVLTCTDSGWDSATPVCLPRRPCPGISTVENGVNQGTCWPNGQPGQTCTIKCQPNFILSTNETSFETECSPDGTWSDTDIPFCVRVFCSIIDKPDSNTDIIGDCTPGLAGNTCQFVCASGYVLDGPSNLLCLENGTWSGDVPSCTRNTCPSINTQPGVILSGDCTPGIVGESCRIACPVGYKIIGKNTIGCKDDGTWDSRFPSCSRSNGGNPSGNNGNCPSINPVNGRAYGACRPGIKGRRCGVVCYRGFQLRGNSVVTCQNNGQWSGVAPSCIRCRNRFGIFG